MNGLARSNTTVYTESRNMLKPIKSVSKTNIAELTKKNMILRAKKLSLDSDSLRKTLQDKYEQKEVVDEKPQVRSMGVRRYKGSKSALGPNFIEPNTFEQTLGGNITDGRDANNNRSNGKNRNRAPFSEQQKEPTLSEVNEDCDSVNDAAVTEEVTLSDAEYIEMRLAEVDSEVERINQELTNEDAVLKSLVEEEQSKPGSCERITMHDAASNGDMRSLVSVLTRGGCDINAPNDDGLTVVDLSYNAGNTLAIRLLAKHGADLSLQDSIGRSLLHRAVIDSRPSMVATLLREGCKCDTKDSRRGRTPLHIATLENELVMLKMLVESLSADPWAAGDVLSLVDTNGRSPLHIAAAGGRMEAVHLLLSAGYSVTQKDLYGQTPMHAALSMSHTNRRCAAVLKLLLEAGGDLAIREEHPDGGQDYQSSNLGAGEDDSSRSDTSREIRRRISLAETGSSSQSSGRPEGVRRRATVACMAEEMFMTERMIHMASRTGCADCINLLLEYGAPVNSTDTRNRTPLHAVAESGGQTSAAKVLVSKGADLEARDHRGQTPLHVAIGADNIPMVKCLLTLGANRDARDNIGRSYAEFALLSRRAGAFRALVQEGVFDVAEEGSSILHSSASIGCLQSTQLLLDMDWDTNVVNSEGLTPLHVTIGQGHEDVATLLITEGANIMKRDRKGATALHYAVRWGGSDALLRLLVKKGASLSATDRLGRTPLHYAASKSSIMSDLYILLGGGANINPKDISGLTPLHLAARLGNESLVRILLDRGADPGLKDMYNFTPHDHAQENKHASIMKRIEDHVAGAV